MKDQVTSIEQSRRLLELKDIAAYLPYGLKGKLDNRNSEDPRPLYPLNFVIARRCDKSGYSYELGDEGLIPVLRPMSDLTKEIAHRGDKFVPMVEIGKMLGYRNLERYEHDGQVEYGWEVRYADDSQGYSFGWHDKTKSFGVWMDEIDQCAPYEINTMNCDVFDKFAEWLFDYRGLIPAGLAVDVNTLPENPYEV